MQTSVNLFYICGVFISTECFHVRFPTHKKKHSGGERRSINGYLGYKE